MDRATSWLVGAYGRDTPDQETLVFDTAPEATRLHLSHDMPCAQCGHARHTFLACSETCSCRPVELAPAAQGSSSTLIARRSSIAV